MRPWHELGVDVRVESWAELVVELHARELIPPSRAAGGHHRSTFAFRGLACARWPLHTSLARLGTPPDAVEAALLRTFRKYARSGSFTRGSDWDVLAVAQHNGLRTRCLDWTTAPLVAAHFATAAHRHRAEDGVVLCLDAELLRDLVLVAPLRRLLLDAQAWVFDIHMLEREFATSADLDATQAGGPALLLWEPPSFDDRIQNQSGILALMNGATLDPDAFLRTAAESCPNLVKRVVIAARAKPEIRDMLDQNNITERLLFPGLPGLSHWLNRYYGPRWDADDPTPEPDRHHP